MFTQTGLMRRASLIKISQIETRDLVHSLAAISQTKIHQDWPISGSSLAPRKVRSLSRKSTTMERRLSSSSLQQLPRVEIVSPMVESPQMQESRQKCRDSYHRPKQANGNQCKSTQKLTQPGIKLKASKFSRIQKLLRSQLKQRQRYELNF